MPHVDGTVNVPPEISRPDRHLFSAKHSTSSGLFNQHPPPPRNIPANANQPTLPRKPIPFNTAVEADLKNSHREPHRRRQELNVPSSSFYTRRPSSSYNTRRCIFLWRTIRTAKSAFLITTHNGLRRKPVPSGRKYNLPIIAAGQKPSKVLHNRHRTDMSDREINASSKKYLNLVFFKKYSSVLKKY